VTTAAIEMALVALWLKYELQQVRLSFENDLLKT
jgi:hypothetical protein